MHGTRMMVGFDRVSSRSNLRRRRRLSAELLERRDLLSVTPVGDPFRVNSISEGNQTGAIVATDTEGNFLVA